MDNPDQRAAVRKLTAILRRVTRVIQWGPFVYLAAYALLALAESAMTEELLCLRDSLLAFSPAINAGLLFFSRLLELCRWHKAACIIPLTSTATDYIDNYLFQFTQNEIMAINITVGVTAILFLLLANHHFFGDGCKRNHTANA